jgi:hypothetical protein
MFGHWKTMAGVTSLAAMTALGACSSSSTSPTTPSMTAAEADTAAAVLTADADGLSDGATSTGSTNVAAAFSIVPVGSQAATNGGSSVLLLCNPTRSPLPVVNADSDAVPDSVRVDWTGCLINHPFAAESLAGTIDYIDPTPAVKDHQLKRVYTDFLIQKRRIVRGDTISDEWNGPQTFSRDSSHTQFTETAFTLVHTFPNGHTATHVRTWSSTFTADTAGTILDDTPLPSGLRNITGSSSWTWGSKTWSFAVTTNPPLHRNDACTTVPLFDSGVMTVVATRPSETTTITITFTGCGTYTVARS